MNDMPDIQPPGSLIFKGHENTNLSVWPQPMVMALYDFKATKKHSSWETYEVALRDFFQFLALTGLQSPADVTRTHLTSYIEFLKSEKKADRTIRNYCAAASSFFEFLARPMDTKGTALIQSNPWKSVKEALPTINAYEKSDNLREMNVDEYKAILATCDLTTIIGKRDYAIMATTLWTTRRRQEISRMKFGDFKEEDGKVFVRFTQKGGTPILIDLDGAIYTIIKDYWAAAGREMKPGSPAWIATTDVGKNLLKARNIQAKEGEQPLSPSRLDKIIKTRGAKAKIDNTIVDVHMHGLRHLGARILRQLGKDMKEIKERLGHKNIATTDIYLGTMDRVGAEGLTDFAKIALGK